MYRLSMLVAAMAALCTGSVAMAGDKPNEEKAKIPDRVYIQMQTSMGDILLELNQEKAPISTKNFVGYVEDDFYNGTIFHRVINGFMIQGGGFDQNMNQKETKAPIQNEWQNGLKNDRGTIAMARTSAPNSATSQFFINVVNNGALDQPRGGAAYAVFGKVIMGMDVVDKIKGVKTGQKKGMGDVPVETVVIKDVSVIDPNAADAKPEIKKAIEQAARDAEMKAKEEAMKAEKDWEAAMKLVKSKEGDPAKGVKTDSGLWYTDISVGDGATPPNSAATVEVHYTGWLVDGTKFDSSRDRGKTATFPLNRVIKGWTEGVGSMKVGTRRILVIPYDLAYGASGRPPTIPPKATLIFDVELVDIK